MDDTLYAERQWPEIGIVGGVLGHASVQIEMRAGQPGSAGRPQHLYRVFAAVTVSPNQGNIMTVHRLVPRRLAGLVASTLMLLAIVLLTAAPSSARATVAEAMAADARVHQDGGFEEALVHWERARMQAQDSGDVQAQARPLRGAAP